MYFWGRSYPTEAHAKLKFYLGGLGAEQMDFEKCASIATTILEQ